MDAIAQLTGELDANGSAYWVGQRADNSGEFFEVTVTGNAVMVRRGKIGQKGDIESETYLTREAALAAGARELRTAATLYGFGPPTG